MIAGLYGIVDTSAAPDRTHVEVAEAFVAGGARTLQLRMKGASDEAFAATLRDVLAVAGDALVIANDRLEVAAAFDGVGLHLGQEDLDPREARARLGPDRVIGWSTHTVPQVRAAAAMSVDYVGFGPVFSAAGKHRFSGDRRAPMRSVGLDGLRAACEAAELPLVAIGGIKEVDVPELLRAGVDSVAVISAVAAAEDMAAAARRISDAFDRRKDET